MSEDRRGGYLALVIAAFAVQGELTSAFLIFFVASLPLVVLVYHALGRVSIVVAYVAGGGLINRLDWFPPGGWAAGSDALRFASEATGVALAGGNPYVHVYTMSIPPGQVGTVYSPPLLLLHAPGQWLAGLTGAMLTQVVAAAVVMAILVWLAARTSWVLGLPALALYASLPFLVFLTINGTNDTAVGAAVLVGALILLRAIREPSTANLVLAGVAMALTFGAKQFVWPVAFVLLAYAGRQVGWRAAGTIAAVGAATWVLVALPFIAMDPAAFYNAIIRDLVVPKAIFGWNIWNPLQEAGIIVPVGTLLITVGATLAMLVVACLVRWRTYGEAILGGIGVALILLFTTRWTSASYLPLFAALAFAAPMLGAGRRLMGETEQGTHNPASDVPD